MSPEGVAEKADRELSRLPLNFTITPTSPLSTYIQSQTEVKRPEGNNPLDLNNLPAEDYYYTISCTDGGKLNSQEYTSSSAAPEEEEVYCIREREKKSGGDGKDDEQGGAAGGKVYECRFCSLKFCKSQALGGHMNRHRQERETESLNKARQLVLSNDLAPAHHLSYVSSGQAFSQGGYHHHTISNMGGEPFRSSMYHQYPAAAAATRLFPTSSVPFMSIPPPPPPPQAGAGSYMYASPPRILSFPTPPPQPNDYFLGHVLSPRSTPPAAANNYTCIGAPVVGHGGGFTNGPRGLLEGPDLPMHNQEDGHNWGRRS